MNYDLLIIFALVASFSVITAIATRAIRRKFGYKKYLIFFGQLLLLLPWLSHYNYFLRMANSNEFSWQVFLVPFAILMLVILIVQIDSMILRAANFLVPSLAYMATYYYVMPTVYAATQNYVFDNIPTIWLFFWTIVATSILLAYVFPVQALKLGKHDRNN